MARRSADSNNKSTANLGFEAKLWLPVGNSEFRNPHSAMAASLHPDLRADYVLANPPFNDSGWSRTAMREAQDPKQGRPTCRVWGDKDDDVRWQWSEATWTGSPEGEHNQAHQYGVPPRGNANFAWVQHFIHHLAPQGMAGFVLARLWFSVKLKAACVFTGLGNRASVSFRECRRAPLVIERGRWKHSSTASAGRTHHHLDRMVARAEGAV